MLITIVGVGLAGAGKTTALRPLAARHDLTYISKDAIVEEITGHPHTQSHRPLADRHADIQTLAALMQGKSVVLDSTFVNGRKRRMKINFLRSVGVSRIVGLYFNTPFTIASSRNRRRRYVVPEDILLKQLHHLQQDPPALEDGFDSIYHADQLNELELMELQRRL